MTAMSRKMNLHDGTPCRHAEENSGSTVRCAVYTRGSRRGGPWRAFDSPTVQRQMAEAFIASRRHEGWVALPERYDDEGSSGIRLDRPALRRLLADARGYKLDCVVVYKVDRLSRSWVDFARLMDSFQTYGVGVLSVTEPFTTLYPLRALMVSTLSSFARLQCGLMAERTQGPARAARRKGNWGGGAPMLGYDLDRRTHRLVVNDVEAERVRAIFELYLERRDASAVARELRRRGWRTKRYVPGKGRPHGGKPFTRCAVYYVLKHVAYTGGVEHDGALCPGEHEAIVDETLWQEVQELLHANARARSKVEKNKHGALLKGLLYCDACDAPMRHTCLGSGRGKAFRYYSCVDSSLRIRARCRTKSVRAAELEAMVVNQIRSHASASPAIAQSVRATREQNAKRLEELEAARSARRQQLKILGREMVRLTRLIEWLRLPGRRGDEPLAELREQLHATEERMKRIRAELVSLHRETVVEKRKAKALLLFDPAWESLDAREQWHAMRQLVERVGYHGRTRKVTVRFRAPMDAVLSSSGHSTVSFTTGGEERPRCRRR